jgi:hypothetical protein
MVAVLLHLGLAAIASVLVWLLLGANLRERGLVLLSGTAGTVGSSLAPLLHAPPKRLATRFAPSPILLPIIFAVAGFAASAGVLILSVALLFENGFEGVSQAGTVAFGAAIGVASGSVLFGAYFETGAGEGPPVLEALAGVDERLFGRPLRNYDGMVIAESHPPDPGDALIRASIRIHMEPRGALDTFQASGSVTPKAASRVIGRVIVQGGRDEDYVPFSISLMPVDLEVFPTRALLSAPVGDPSETLEFKLVKRQEIDSASEGRGGVVSADPRVPKHVDKEHVIIEIAQEGRTLQIVELGVPLPTD